MLNPKALLFCPLLALAAAPATGQQMNMPMGNSHPSQSPPSPPAGEHDHAAMPKAAHSSPAAVPAPMDAMAMPNGSHHMAMSGALGSYPMNRESSGTAWQPDSSEHAGLHVVSGGWTLMAHGSLNLVADTQRGPRGDDKLFFSGHLMGTARRAVGPGTLQLRTIISPDPLMGKRGYPLLLASGETANGRDRLIDRQHPHDFIGELSASYSMPLGRRDSVFIYAGLPGEPAFGPPAYFHREAIMDSPEAPITHHWIDSTHVSEGVVTVGIVHDRFKLEASRFNAREPDQHRWNIETGPLDSTAVRLSWNPVPTLALQASWARLIHPEQLEPGINQTRFSASALYADDVAPGWRLAATIAVARRTQEEHDDDAVVLEAALKHGPWTLFGRGESTENRELVPGQDEPAYRVGKISIGGLRDFRVAEHLSLGAGALVSFNFVPGELAHLYGGHRPAGGMGFLRLKLD